MSVAHRIYGKDLNLCQITVGSTPYNLTDCVQTIDVERRVSAVDVGVMQDIEQAQRGSMAIGTIRFTCAIDTDQQSNLEAVLAAYGYSVKYDIVTKSGGVEYTSGSNTALLQGATQAIPDGGQTLSFELVPDGSGGMLGAFT